MLRILLFAAITAGASGLITGAVSQNSTFIDISILVLVAAVPLLILNVFGGLGLASRHSRRAVAEAKESGRVFAALIEEVSETGLTINEQPVLQVEVMVAGAPNAPFRTSGRILARRLDLHRYQVGEFITAAHPDPTTSDIHLIAEAPDPQMLDRFEQAVSRMPEQTLPPGRKPGRGWVQAFPNSVPARLTAYLTTIVIAAVGMPMLLHSLPSIAADGAPLARTDSDIFSDEGLQEGLSAIEEEVGSAEAFEIVLYDTYLIAETPTEAGSGYADRVTYRYGGITSREPASIQPSEPDEERFLTTDVEWSAVMHLAEEGPALAAAEGVEDAEVSHIVVHTDPISGELTVRMFVSNDYDSITVIAAPTGEILQIK